MSDGKTLIYPRLMECFSEAPLNQIEVTVRRFPFRASADLQCALETLTEAQFEVLEFHALSNSPPDFASLYVRDRMHPIYAVPPEYFEIDIGRGQSIRALRGGCWIMRHGEIPIAALLQPDRCGLNVHAAVVRSTESARVIESYFKHLEGVVEKSPCYRGKILSLEQREMYSGQGMGIMVHDVKNVGREEVILPAKTLTLLDRNVLEFVAQRPRLAKFGMAIKKGLLFYGPPGTGKTHTVQYLAHHLPGHTTFLITAAEVAHLSEYMTLARLLQPSLVVIEDVDLIARDRTEMRSAGEESMLNQLLNEMDGLRADAQLLFVLTTNRASALEPALASRPGRVDQAIEFPLPDSEGRKRLVKLYAQGAPISEACVDRAVAGSQNVSAAFIKELMRRAFQFCLVRTTEDSPEISTEDIDQAIAELLNSGELNRSLLGAIAGVFAEPRG